MPRSQAKLVPGSWILSIDAFDNWLAVADKSPRTRELRRHQLGRLARAFPNGPDTVTHEALVAWLASMTWEAETRRSARSCLREFFHWATTRGYVESDPADALPTIKRAQPQPRPVAEAVWQAARELADSRLALMIDLGAQLGLRRAEIAAVHRDDVVSDSDGWSLIVHGKGRRERIVPLSAGLAERLLRSSGWVFPGGKPGTHLTADRVGRLMRGASHGDWSTHQLRHRFASTVYNASGDLLSTQKLLGHSKPETTQGYVRIADKRLRAAAATAVA